MTNEKLCIDLERHGCVENKTKILTFPSDELVPRELKYSFLRGYIDGDGSVGFSYSSGKIEGYVSLTGTKNFLEGVKSFIGKSNLALDKRYKEKDDNIYSLTIGGNIQVIELCYRLYRNASTYMDRKYNNYRMLVEEYFK